MKGAAAEVSRADGRYARLYPAAALVGVALAMWAATASFYVVDITEHVLVTRFGAVTRVVSEPGLHFKAPLDRVTRLDRRLTFSRPRPAEYLTTDKKNIVVESLITWRIADPERYFARLAVRPETDAGLAEVMLGEIGSVLGNVPSASLIAPQADSKQFRNIVRKIRERVAGFARTAYGIDVVDVELVRLGLPEQNRASVFERMKAERGRMAKEYRTAGELLARQIIAEADRERGRIEAEAYSQAQGIKAEGDAQATRIYSAAYSRNPAFYKFLRTLQAYEKFLDESTTLFLPADAEVLRVLEPLPEQGSAPSLQPYETAGKLKSSARTAGVLHSRDPRSEPAPARAEAPGAGTAR